MTQTYYVTTAIDYANAGPHLGHAYEKVATDVMARFHRLIGETVFFLTGTDEHGTKVEKTAAVQGLAPRAYTDRIADEFKSAWAHLNLSYDHFVRTTDPAHYQVVTALWNRFVEQGDIYKAKYTGLYCAGCENFVTKRDLTETGECPHHQVKPEPVEEENYFFKLTRYKEALKAQIQSHPEFILPEFRATEILRLLEDIEDISVSRSIHSVTWGIPVPNDPDQRIYVWIDALSNYLTGVGYLQNDAQFNQFWPANLHVIGKDILKFHAIYWPCMLMAAGLPLPKAIFAHGFITINESKISKSVGNVISPMALSERFALPNTDPIRYYLMASTPFGNDGNFSEEDFKLRINADLANNLGNLLNRTLNMTLKYFDGKVPQAAFKAQSELINKIKDAYTQNAFHTAADLTFHLVDDANKQINEQEPWNLYKEGKLDELATLMYGLLETLRQVAILLSPLTPILSANILSQLGYTEALETFTWQDILQKPLPVEQAIHLQGPILPRLESEIVGAAKKK